MTIAIRDDSFRSECIATIYSIYTIYNLSILDLEEKITIRQRGTR